MVPEVTTSGLGANSGTVGMLTTACPLALVTAPVSSNDRSQHQEPLVIDGPGTPVSGGAVFWGGRVETGNVHADVTRQLPCGSPPQSPVTGQVPPAPCPL